MEDDGESEPGRRMNQLKRSSMVGTAPENGALEDGVCEGERLTGTKAGAEVGVFDAVVGMVPGGRLFSAALGSAVGHNDGDASTGLEDARLGTSKVGLEDASTGLGDARLGNAKVGLEDASAGLKDGVFVGASVKLDDGETEVAL